MAKIDTAKIEGFDNLTPEQKVEALLSLEIEQEKPDYTGYVRKDLFDKTASELSKLKKEALDRLSEDEKAKKIAEEEMEKLRSRNAELEKNAMISSYKAKYLATGYSEELAAATAEAFANGDMETVFANQNKFLADHDKKVKAGMLGHTATPPAGSGASVLTKEDIMKEKDTEKRQALIRENLSLFGVE